MPCLRLAFMTLFLAAAPAVAYELADAGGQEDLTPAMRAKTEVIAQALEDIAPEGWEAGGPVERYTTVNMYDKINGRSELFMSYDVTGMAFVSLYDQADETRYIDIFLYDQTTPLGAFGVYSVERWPGNPAVPVGRDGYRTDTDLFFWHGQYYASILSLAEDEAMQAAQLAVAKTLASRLKDSGEPLWGLGVLPEAGRQTASIQYFQVDAMSIDFMTDTFSAEYGEGDDTVRRFVSRQPDAETAKAIAAKFGAYLQDYGASYGEEERDGVALVYADFGGGYIDAAFAHGRYVAGVTAVQGLDRALASAAALAKALPTK